MTLDERIEAGKVAARTAFYGPATFDQAMEAGIRAFAPELFTSPPTGWIAPRELTEEMLAATSMEPKAFVMMAYEDMRDAYLNREGK